MEEGKQYVIVGLGNPGKAYALTRHNMGYLVVQAFGDAQGWTFREEKHFQALVTKGKIGHTTVHLLLPLTYMNLSGRAVKPYLDFYKLGSDSLIVVVDDIALAFGEMRVRSFGSAGGHNGLKSIQAHLQTQHYVRLRMGIGYDPSHRSLVDHVLDTFTSEERLVLPGLIESGVAIVKRMINEPVSLVMNTVNKKLKKEEAPKGPGDKTA